MYVPNKILELFIYDALYNGTHFIIIVRGHTPYYDMMYNNKKFNCHRCSHNHTYIYSLKDEYKSEINVIVDKEYNIKINQYPLFKDEIIFSTLVKGEDNYVKQWVEYHYKLGVQRFIIYENSLNIELENILKEWIEKKIVFLFQWNYNYDEQAQQTQQNHSLYAFKTSKYIGFFDIDEYLNIQTDIKIEPFLKQFEQDNISGFQFLNKFFYNPNRLPTDGNKFLYIYECDNITELGREKGILKPFYTKSLSVHMVTDGYPLYRINTKDAFFNHYCYLNKHNRGFNVSGLIDTSIHKNSAL